MKLLFAQLCLLLSYLIHYPFPFIPLYFFHFILYPLLLHHASSFSHFIHYPLPPQYLLIFVPSSIILSSSIPPHFSHFIPYPLLLNTSSFLSLYPLFSPPTYFLISLTLILILSFFIHPHPITSSIILSH